MFCRISVFIILICGAWYAPSGAADLSTVLKSTVSMNDHHMSFPASRLKVDDWEQINNWEAGVWTRTENKVKELVSYSETNQDHHRSALYLSSNDTHGHLIDEKKKIWHCWRFLKRSLYLENAEAKEVCRERLRPTVRTPDCVREHYLTTYAIYKSETGRPQGLLSCDTESVSRPKGTDTISRETTTILWDQESHPIFKIVSSQIWKRLMPFDEGKYNSKYLREDLAAFKASYGSK